MAIGLPRSRAAPSVVYSYFKRLNQGLRELRGRESQVRLLDHAGRHRGPDQAGRRDQRDLLVLDVDKDEVAKILKG